MTNSQIAVSFEIPEDDSYGPYIKIDTMGLLEATIEQGCSNTPSLLKLIHQAGRPIDLEELINQNIESWEPADQIQVAEDVANWLENVASKIRQKSEALSLELKPRMSPGM